MALDPTPRIIEALFMAQRLGNSINAEAKLLLDALFDQIAADLRRIDPAGPSLLRWRRYRTDQFIAQVRERLREVRPEWEKLVKARLAEAGRVQALYTETTLRTVLGSADGLVKRTPITQARLRVILNTDPFQGATLKEWAAGMERATLDRVTRQIRLGMTLEESVPQMVERVRGRQAGYIRQDPRTGAFVRKGTRGAVVKPRYVGGVYQATTRDAETIVRTGVAYVNNIGLRETYQENASVLGGLQFVSVLDDRTSPICQSLDGEVWPLDSADIRQPPLHPNCRSVLVPVVDWEGLGLDPPEDLHRFARDLSGVDPADLDRKVSARRRTGDLGTSVKVPSSVRYTDWLKAQSTATQNKILGPSRAKLFRAGKVTLKDLVRDDATIIPLSDLAA